MLIQSKPGRQFESAMGPVKIFIHGDSTSQSEDANSETSLPIGGKNRSSSHPSFLHTDPNINNDNQTGNMVIENGYIDWKTTEPGLRTSKSMPSVPLFIGAVQKMYQDTLGFRNLVAIDAEEHTHNEKCQSGQQKECSLPGNNILHQNEPEQVQVNYTNSSFGAGKLPKKLSGCFLSGLFNVFDVKASDGVDSTCSTQNEKLITEMDNVKNNPSLISKQQNTLDTLTLIDLSCESTIFAGLYEQEMLLSSKSVSMHTIE